MVAKVKLLGVKMKPFDVLSSRVIMLQATPALVNLATMKSKFLFTNAASPSPTSY